MDAANLMFMASVHWNELKKVLVKLIGLGGLLSRPVLCFMTSVGLIRMPRTLTLVVLLIILCT